MCTLTHLDRPVCDFRTVQFDTFLLRFIPKNFELPSTLTHDRPLSSWTVHFGSNDRPVWLNTVHFRATVHFKDRPLSPFRTVHIGPDSVHRNVGTDQFLGFPWLFNTYSPNRERSRRSLADDFLTLQARLKSKLELFKDISHLKNSVSRPGVI